MSTPMWARLGSLTAAAGLTVAALAGLALMRIDPPSPPEPADGPALEFVTERPPEPPPPSPVESQPAAPVADGPLTLALPDPILGVVAPVDVVIGGGDHGGDGATAAPPVVRTAVPLGLPPRPSYPPRALAREKDGDVRVRLLIAPDGTVSRVVVVSETPAGWGFADAAIVALRAARFEPKRVDGVAVPGEFEYTVRFRLD